MEAGILRVVGDHVVLFVVAQKLVVRNCRSWQDAKIYPGAVGIGRKAVGFVELGNGAAVGGKEAGAFVAIVGKTQAEANA